jgi:ribonuclease-3
MPGEQRDQGRNGTLEALAAVLGHRFANPSLLAEALTHRSAARSDGHRFGYERLEFLGDRVLGLVIADLIFDVFPAAPEGELARRLTALVRRETLVEVAAGLGLGGYLQLSDSEARAGGRDNPGLQADACEAVIGALYLDGGLEAARHFIHTHWRPLVETAGAARRDPKTRLQEWAQACGLPLPEYRTVSETGPAHQPEFTMEVRIEGAEPVRATARTKRRAEQDAARALLAVIDAGAEEGRGNGGRQDD